MKLNEKLPYATIYGHAEFMFEQNGRRFDAAKNLIDEEGPAPVAPVKGSEKKQDMNGDLVTDDIAKAVDFLKNILSGGAIAKAIIFKEAEGVPMRWEDVKKASQQIGVIPSQRHKIEFWQLPES